MKTAPVSFGRAIRVKGSIENAHKIAKSANSAISITRLDSFAKSIFTDTDIAKAKVVALAEDEIYIFSGDEAKKQSEISSNLKFKISEKNKLVDSLPDREIRAKRKHQAARENYCDAYIAIYQMKKMSENGGKGHPKSVIDVDSKKIKNSIFGVKEVISSATYTSKSGSKTVKIEYKG